MKKYCSAIFWGICFIIFTVLVKFVDVQPVGTEASLIGFANLNTAVFQLLGTNDFCYRLTQCLGIVAIATAARYAIDGFIQLIKRKSLFKVDREIIMVGIIYAIVIILYVLFEKLAINYRPVVLEDGLEASYPSTHTMLILTILGTVLPLAGRYISNPKIALLAKLLCIVIMWLTVVCRLLSGVHWFTDIIGGVLISLCLISLFKSLLRR
jgi:undecaprenyl-diphosphatase